MARIFQDSREKRIVGAKKAPWWVEWRENGRRRSQKVGKRSDAKKFAALKESETLHRRNGIATKKSWREFRAEYEANVLPVKAKKSHRTAEKEVQILNTFERTMKPDFVTYIDKRTMDEFMARRLKAPGKKKGDTLSLATLDSELGTLQAILNHAVGWGYLPALPQFPKVKPHQEGQDDMKPADFEAIWKACDVAVMPRPEIHPSQPYTPAEWWRGLLGLISVTGMRISDVLAIRWADVDLDGGRILSRAKNNKGKRDQYHYIRPAIELLKPLRGFDPRLFPWNHHRRTLDVEFHRIQREAGIHLDCPGDHEHTDTCHLYGFHAIRYGFATLNEGRMTDRELQEQMGHASFETTKRYIKHAQQQRQKDLDVFVPAALKALAGG